MVVDLIDIMHRGPGLPRPGGQNRFVHVVPVHPMPSEVRKQCRVNVHDASAKRRRNVWRNHPQVSGQSDEIDPMPGE
jgi:hypothetical protein